MPTKPSRKLRKTGKPYARAVDNEWITPVHDGYKMACCDCGLVHVMDFRVFKDSKGRLSVKFRARRNNRSTAMMRRHGRIRVRATILRKPVKP